MKRVGRQRQAIVDSTDAIEDPPSGEEEDEEAAAARQAALARRVPSKEAMDKFEDYRGFQPFTFSLHVYACLAQVFRTSTPNMQKRRRRTSI